MSRKVISFEEWCAKQGINLKNLDADEIKYYKQLWRLDTGQ